MSWLRSDPCWLGVKAWSRALDDPRTSYGGMILTVELLCSTLVNRIIFSVPATLFPHHNKWMEVARSTPVTADR